MLMTLGIALLFFPAVYFGNMWFGFKGLTWAFPFTQVLACALVGAVPRHGWREGTAR